VQYQNGSTSTAGKGAIQSEVDELTKEIDRISGSDVFNGVHLLDSSAAAVTFQAGTAMLAQANQAPQSVLNLLRQ
jgi:flagellin